VAIRAENAEILNTIVLRVAVDVIEMERKGSVTPRFDSATGAATGKNSFAKQPFFQRCSATAITSRTSKHI
jgi:hypothetical protein